ncbi:hypothetical protein N7507_008856, partial [Penicillium longicatenatum]
AYGEFEATRDCSDFTSASFLNKVGKKTPVLQRVSTVGPEAGSADTSRDVHGWALKFYTDEGNMDWVFNNTPVLFIRDPIKFPSLNRSHKRHPRTHLPDANMFWDDRGTPKSIRHMNAYSGHAYKFTKPDGSFKYAKIHVKTQLGVENFTKEEATKIAGGNPDYLIQDMFEAIERGDFPVWNVYVQLMTPDEAKNYRWNIFDMTKVWPHKDFPLLQIGRLKMNRNNSQITTSRTLNKPHFHRLQWCQDLLHRLILVILQARLFAYPDAARYRIGVNYQQLPTNAAKAPVYCPFQRDGAMRFDGNYGADPNYVSSSLQPTKFYPAVKKTDPAALSLHTKHEKWVGEVVSYASHVTDEDFIQPAALWEVIGREPGHHDRCIGNIVAHLKGVKSHELRRAVYGLFSRINKSLGLMVQERTEEAVRSP